MRKLIVISSVWVSALVLLASCHPFGKKGNGKISTEQRSVQPFTRVSIEGIFPVEITQTGEAEGVKVETDENLQECITVRNEGGKLVVESEGKPSIRSTKMKVTVNVKQLREIEFSSVGNLTTANTLKLDSIEINSESVGKMDLDIEANYLHADLSSVGSTTLSGKVREARINNKSVGKLAAYGLKAQTMMIHNTAVGAVEIYADSAFYIRSSAIGTLHYRGPGVVKELSSEGIGKVKKGE